MKLTKVCCQGCGADLQVDDSMRFVTCNYCHSRLAVVHDPTTTHTRLLDEIGKSTTRIENKVRVLELQNDLEQLDREWDNRRESLQVRDRQGNASNPSAVGSMIGGVIMVVFGIFWTATASSMGAPGFFPLFGLVFIGAAIFSIIHGTTRASAYQSDEASYQARRRRLLDSIERERGS